MNTVSLNLEHAHQPGTTVMGIDEAGRGPLAGPVFAAAVSVPLDVADSLLAGPWAAINDSKKLSEKKRDALAQIIKSTPSCTWAVASASALEIDQLNILRATHLAMRRAALALAEAIAGPNHEPQTTNHSLRHPRRWSGRPNAALPLAERGER